MKNCEIKNCEDEVFKKGDLIEFTHKGAKYIACVENKYTEQQLKGMGKDILFPYHLIGIRIGSIIGNQENESGDFISCSDSWWSLGKNCKILIKNVL
jgi:hypothetical protein